MLFIINNLIVQENKVKLLEKIVFIFQLYLSILLLSNIIQIIFDIVMKMLI
jgi:hypothetical protein